MIRLIQFGTYNGSAQHVGATKASAAVPAGQLRLRLKLLARLLQPSSAFPYSDGDDSILVSWISSCCSSVDADLTFGVRGI